jgi:hypothetical protein
MKRSLIHLSRIAVVLSVTFNSPDVFAQHGSGQGCPANIEHDTLRQELERASSAAIDAIKSGKPDKLMPLLATRGVFLGTDGPLVSLSAIHQEMSARTGIYCVIYDSACLKKEVNDSRKKAGAPPDTTVIMSFRDQLVKSNVSIKTTMSSDASSCGGTTSGGSPSFDLEWERTSSGWKIAAIPYL